MKDFVHYQEYFKTFLGGWSFENGDKTLTIKKIGEESKVAIRNLRKKANEEVKKEEKNGDLTEDDLKSDEKDIQKATDDGIKRVDEVIAKKEQEIMEV